MNLCTKRPDSLPLLDSIGLDPSTAPSRPLSTRASKHNTSSLDASGVLGLQRQDNTGLGLGFASLAKGGSSAGSFQASSSPVFLAPKLAENWRASSNTERNLPPDEACALVDQSFKPMLDSLTVENFNWTFSQITEWMIKGEEKPGASELKRVVELVCEKAQSEEGSSKTCAILFQKMMKHVSLTVQDEAIRTPGGELIVGSALFQRCMLNRCQEDFRSRWSNKYNIAVSETRGDRDQESIGEGREKAGEEVLQRNEDEVFARFKSQWLGTIRFIGELFKLRLLTARMMHSSIMKLLSNADERDIEGLSVLMKIAGPNLERLQSWNHMDVYFDRMQDILEGSDTSLKMKVMLKVSYCCVGITI